MAKENEMEEALSGLEDLDDIFEEEDGGESGDELVDEEGLDDSDPDEEGEEEVVDEVDEVEDTGSDDIDNLFGADEEEESEGVSDEELGGDVLFEAEVSEPASKEEPEKGTDKAVEPRRGRGRPKGSKNKATKATETAKSAKTTEAAETTKAAKAAETTEAVESVEAAKATGKVQKGSQEAKDRMAKAREARKSPGRTGYPRLVVGSVRTVIPATFKELYSLCATKIPGVEILHKKTRSVMRVNGHPFATFVMDGMGVANCTVYLNKSANTKFDDPNGLLGDAADLSVAGVGYKISVTVPTQIAALKLIAQHFKVVRAT